MFSLERPIVSAIVFGTSLTAGLACGVLAGVFMRYVGSGMWLSLLVGIVAAIVLSASFVYESSK